MQKSSIPKTSELKKIRIPKIDQKRKIKETIEPEIAFNFGIDQLIKCWNDRNDPATRDKARNCFYDNLWWLLNNYKSSLAKCILTSAFTNDQSLTPDPNRRVASGYCKNFLGQRIRECGCSVIGDQLTCPQYVPGVIQFNVTPVQVYKSCKERCDAYKEQDQYGNPINFFYEQAGCDGGTYWCWCNKNL